MLTITITGSRGEGKTELSWYLYSLLKLAGHEVSKPKETNTPPSQQYIIEKGYGQGFPELFQNHADIKIVVENPAE